MPAEGIHTTFHPLEEAAMKNTPQSQLSLLTQPSWRLDDRTREIGRRGVACARQALRQGRAGRGDVVDPAQRQAA